MIKYLIIMASGLILAFGCHKNTIAGLTSDQTIALNVALDSTITERVAYRPGDSIKIKGSLAAEDFTNPKSYRSIERLMYRLASVRQKQDAQLLFMNNNFGIYENKFDNQYLNVPARTYQIIHSIFVRHENKKFYFVKFKEYYASASSPRTRGVIMTFENNRFYLLNHTPSGLEDTFEWSIRVKSDLAKYMLRLKLWDISSNPKYILPEKYQYIVKQCKNFDGGINIQKFNQIIKNTNNKSLFYDEVDLYHY